MHRRTLLKTAGISPLALIPTVTRAHRPKRILFLGGRGFLGPVIIDRLLRAGHEVTLFNRGVTNPHLFPQLRWIAGDREERDDGGLSGLVKVLQSETFDWVIDTWQKHPAAVLESASLLKDRTHAYHYVSSLSVYKSWGPVGIAEDVETNEVPPDAFDWSVDHRYGLRKSLAELAVKTHFPRQHCLFRSHGMRGFAIYEPIDEPYWPVRIRRAGDVLVPGDGAHLCQVTDMVSLAEFMNRCGEERTSGVYNVAYEAFQFSNYLETLRALVGTEPAYHWIDQATLEANDIQPYRDIPLWRPRPEGAYRFSVAAAEHAGLRNRPIAQMVSDQLAGYLMRNPGDDFRFGHPGTISMAREQELLRDLGKTSGGDPSSTS